MAERKNKPVTERRLNAWRREHIKLLAEEMQRIANAIEILTEIMERADRFR